MDFFQSLTHFLSGNFWIVAIGLFTLYKIIGIEGKVTYIMNQLWEKDPENPKNRKQ